MKSILLRWLGPVIITLLVMVGYQLWVGPTIADLLDDWSFLHQAKIATIKQAQQRAQPPPVQK